MIRQVSLFALGMILCLSVSTPLKADTIEGSVEDVSVRSTGAGATGSGFGFLNRNADLITFGRFVTNAGDPANAVALYSFQLPDLGAVANPFGTADLEFVYSGPTSNTLQTFNGDLYGIDSRAADAAVTTDYFVGPGPDSRGTTTLLQEDILTPDSAATSTINSVDIADYLNGLYDNGAGVGEFAYFRLSPDFEDTSVIDGSREGYLVFGANVDNELAPVINFTNANAVPEPSTSTVLFLGMAAIAFRRRRGR